MFDFKGKSLIEFPDNYVVVDLETTGLELEFDNIIEISALKVMGGQIVDKFSTLVQPPKPLKYIPELRTFQEQDYFVTEFISELTGITNEMLENAPKIKDVLPSFKDFVGESVLVGHNIVAFDANFLCDAFQKLGVEFCNDYIDTRRIALWLLKELKHLRLSDIATHFGIEYTDAHRAENDCIITNNCFKMLKAEAEKQYSSVEAFMDYLKEKRKKIGIRSKDIKVTVDEIDIENPIYGKHFVFTGALSKMERKEAMQIVKNLGGENDDNITKKTNFLVIGNLDFAKTIEKGKSSKMLKAEKYKAAGQDIEVISENTFYMLIES